VASERDVVHQLAVAPRLLRAPRLGVARLEPVQHLPVARLLLEGRARLGHRLLGSGHRIVRDVHAGLQRVHHHAELLEVPHARAGGGLARLRVGLRMPRGQRVARVARVGRLGLAPRERARLRLLGLFAQRQQPLQPEGEGHGVLRTAAVTCSPSCAMAR
jgi:hypothetical protein